MFDSRQMWRKYEDKILVDRTAKGAYYINQRGRAKGNPKTARKGSQKVGAKWQRRWLASRLSSSQSTALSMLVTSGRRMEIGLLSRAMRLSLSLRRCLSPSASRVLSRLARRVSVMRTLLTSCGMRLRVLSPLRMPLRRVSLRLWPLKRRLRSFAWVLSLDSSRRCRRVRRLAIVRLVSLSTWASR